MEWKTFKIEWKSVTVHLQGAGLCYNRNRHCYHNDVHVSLLLNVTLSWAQRWTTRDLRVRLCLFSISQLCACCCFNRPTFRIAVCEYSFLLLLLLPFRLFSTDTSDTRTRSKSVFCCFVFAPHAPFELRSLPILYVYLCVYT